MKRTQCTRRPLMAPRCLNSIQLAGLSSLSNLVFIPVAWGEGCGGDEWTLLHGQSSWLRASVSCFPGWITPLLLVLCSEHSYACTSVSKNIECWSLLETRTALCFVFSVVTHPQHSKLFLPWVLWGLQDLHAIPIESGLCSWLDRLRETGWPRLPTLWQTLELPGMHS